MIARGIEAGWPRRPAARYTRARSAASGRAKRSRLEGTDYTRRALLSCLGEPPAAPFHACISRVSYTIKFRHLSRHRSPLHRRIDGGARRYQGNDCFGTDFPARSRPSQIAYAAPMDYGTQGPALPTECCKKDSHRSWASSRTLIYLLPSRWLHGRCRQRSHRC